MMIFFFQTANAYFSTAYLSFPIYPISLFPFHCNYSHGLLNFKVFVDSYKDICKIKELFALLRVFKKKMI